MWCVLCVCCCFCFFFFKQKTAYEMRISDWSSDVCSSDLDPGMVRARKVIDGRDGDYLLLRQYRHAVADGIKRVEIMGDHEDGEAKRLAQGGNERVELARCDRIKTCGRFVEEQYVGIECDHMRHTRALTHAT